MHVASRTISLSVDLAFILIYNPNSTNRSKFLQLLVLHLKSTMPSIENGFWHDGLISNEPFIFLRNIMAVKIKFSDIINKNSKSRITIFLFSSDYFKICQQTILERNSPLRHSLQQRRTGHGSCTVFRCPSLLVLFLKCQNTVTGCRCILYCHSVCILYFHSCVIRKTDTSSITETSYIL